MITAKRLLVVLLISFLKIIAFPRHAAGQETTPPPPEHHTVCAIGDSQVEEHAFLISALRTDLGEGYTVVAQGRRGWTTGRWIAAGDFGTVCGDADIILISLGGNDLRSGFSLRQIEANVSTLRSQLPPTVRVVYHMMIPRLFKPGLDLADDGVHLTYTGARVYARYLARRLRSMIHATDPR